MQVYLHNNTYTLKVSQLPNTLRNSLIYLKIISKNSRNTYKPSLTDFT